MQSSIAAINSFERQLADDGTIILKYFLHISKEEQRRRLDERERNLLTSWMITKGDWDFHHHYDSYKPVIEEFIIDTDKPYAPWIIIEATDSNYARLKLYSTAVKRLKKHLDQIERNGKQGGMINGKNNIQKPQKTVVKRKSEAPVEYSRPEYEKQLLRCQEKVRDIQYLLYKRKSPLIIVYEGWDAAGKGGNIMRLVRLMNPRGYDVVSITRPDQTELDHHYLWRFYQRFPKAGHITIFDRSWYGRVLVLASISSTASSYSFHFARFLQSSSVIFHCLRGSSWRSWNLLSCSSLLTSSQNLMRPPPAPMYACSISLIS
jgi:polyphosphate kinase 2 (PPK2 family)